MDNYIFNIYKYMGKICKKCNEIKDKSNFNKDKSKKDGYRNECKDCYKLSRYNFINNSIIELSGKEINKKCSLCGLTKSGDNFCKDKYGKYGISTQCRSCKKEISNENPEKAKIQRSKSYYKNKDKNKDKRKEYYKSDKRKEYFINYNIENRDKISAYHKEWYEINKKDILEKRKEYKSSYTKNNKHITAWRNILHKTLSYLGITKEKRTIELLKYSSTELKNHISSLFIEGMDWSNHGTIWHIDHIIPISKFKKDTPVYIVNSLDNLRPLWVKDNLIKNNKLEIIPRDYFKEYLVI